MDPKAFFMFVLQPSNQFIFFQKALKNTVLYVTLYIIFCPDIFFACFLLVPEYYSD
jgi:hypothetical protein